MNIVYKLILFYILFSVKAHSQSNSFVLSGNVFSDKKNMKKVLISNGDTIVKTNRKGNFKISVKKGQVVFPILPSGYTYSNSKKWWFNVSEENNINKNQQINFKLKKVKEKTNFKFLAIGDIQVGDKHELLQATQSVLKELLNRNDYDFSIYLGDLVNDSPELFTPLKKLIDDIAKPSWVVYGNHDRNFKAGKENQFNFFRQYFGSETYAFFKNNVLFISLNSITPVGKYGYKNIYPQNQIKFLSLLLKNVKPNQKIVISQHIPFVGMKNKDEIIKILNPFKHILFLSGHTHTVFQNEIKMPSGNVIHELTAGAVSGNWWTGQKNWEGIPLSLMSCGTPRGYFEIKFNKDNYQLKYKGVNLPSSKQFSYWLGDYNANIISTLDNNNDIYINAFSGSNNTKVSLKLPSGEVLFLNKERIVDPFINYIKQSQKEKTSPDKNSKPSPYLRNKSRHIWKGVLPKLTKGYHKVDVTIEDPYFLTIHESIWIYKE